MERILKRWQHVLDTYTDLNLKSKNSLLISLIAVIAGLVLTIIVLCLPERLPGT
ncbi:hypothetical protein [Lactobacillus apis]|uniref:hypothetical protein n=1 Tax=Lactobacillus apis TaxID=303541 RepID=UPI00242D4308|nr:hypothetical protein [Lactobacillus apis]